MEAEMPARMIEGRTLAMLIAAAGLCTAAPLATVAEGAPPLGAKLCAMHDLYRYSYIEEHGTAQEVPPSMLSDAFSTMVRARTACDEGRFADGIMLYQSIPFGPVLGKADRR